MTIDIPSAIFLSLLLVLGIILVTFQSKDDDFDLRDVICSWNGKTRAVSTSKTLLAGAFLTSSYYLVKNPTEMAYGAYLLAWVTNAGVVAFQKIKTEAK